MEPSRSSLIENDSEAADLNALLDAFGNVCSLEEIASAYCNAGCDVDKSGELLYELQANKSNKFSTSNGVGNMVSVQPLTTSIKHESETILHRKSKKNQKKMTASVGTVSSVMGKSYLRPPPSRKISSRTSKPPVIVVEGSFLDGQKDESCTPTEKCLSSKEEFLFSILGEGFKLSKEAIKEVLGHCGYNLNKSVEELIALTEKDLNKGKSVALTEDILSNDKNNVAEAIDMKPNLETERSNLPKLLLEAMFSGPVQSTEEPPRRRIQWGLNRTRVVGQKAVTKPVYDTDSLPLDLSWPEVDDVLDENDKYHLMRKASKVHWDTMKEYYRAAVDAFTNGDQTQANYLLEQGNYYNKMAREAIQSSASEIHEKRNEETTDVSLDLRENEPKDAVRLLKFNLHQLAGIGFQFLKVKIDCITEDKTKGRRRKMVLRLLQKHSVKWSEEELHPGTIFIQLDTVDPSKFGSGVESL